MQGFFKFLITEEASPELIEEIREQDEEILNTDKIYPLQKTALNRITADRKRLRLLLEILLRERLDSGLLEPEENARLKEAIAVRKSFYNIDIPEMGGNYDNSQSTGKLSSLIGGRKKNTSINDYGKPAKNLLDAGMPAFEQYPPKVSNSPHSGTEQKSNNTSHKTTDLDKNKQAIKKTRTNSNNSGFENTGLYISENDKVSLGSQKKIVLSSIGAIILLASILTIYSITFSDEDSSLSCFPGQKINIKRDTGSSKNITRSNNILTPEQKENYDNLPASFKSNITNTDIYRYANKVALKNGYAELKDAGIKTKNPHWIYPGNSFVLLDDQKITVSDGDTLWSIAKRKLIEMDIKFDT